MALTMQSSPPLQWIVNQATKLDDWKTTELTKEETMPSIHCNAALMLCKMDDRFHKERQKEETKDSKTDKLSPLQERCATSLSVLELEQWASFLSQEQKLGKLRARKPSFLVDLLAKTLTVNYKKERQQRVRRT